MDYASSSVVITGASRGIGRAIATAFADATDRPLVLISRSVDGLEKTKEFCLDAGASQVHIISCDLTDEKATLDMSIPDDFPVPGILINNAGSFLISSLQETAYDDFMDQIQANLFSAVHTTRRFLPELKKLDRALVVNICSVGALIGLRESGAYSASKHALLGYTRSLRKELLNTNIGVTALNLGQTQSSSWEGSDMNPMRLIDARDVAELIVTLSKLSNRTLAEEILLKPQHGPVPPM